MSLPTCSDCSRNLDGQLTLILYWDDPEVLFICIECATKLSKEEGGQDPLAEILGSRGGKKGGLARAKSLSPECRSGIAKKAAMKRWKKEPER